MTQMFRITKMKTQKWLLLLFGKGEVEYNYEYVTPNLGNLGSSPNSKIR